MGADQWSPLLHEIFSILPLPCASNSFQTLACVLFCSVLFCFHFHFATFSILAAFRYHQGPKTRSHFPVCTYMAGQQQERERERRGKRGMRLAHTVYKISFEHSKIWKNTADIHPDVWVLVGSYCPFTEKKGFDAIWPNGPIFYSKLTIKMESII
jgi:hypothetical protein